MRASGWPAVTVSPVVLTSSCSTQPATRVCTCEIRDSSGTTVATAATLRQRLASDHFEPDIEFLKGGRVDLHGHAVMRGHRSPRADGMAEPVSGANARRCGENGHASRVCCTHRTPVNSVAVATADANGAPKRRSAEGLSLDHRLIGTDGASETCPCETQFRVSRNQVGLNEPERLNSLDDADERQLARRVARRPPVR